MEILKYRKVNLINLFKLNNSLNTSFKLKLKNDIVLKIQKNIFKLNKDKYLIEIMFCSKTIYQKSNNNYLELIDLVHNFLLKNKLITKEEELSFKNENLTNKDEEIYLLSNSIIDNSKIENIKKEDKKIEFRELNEFERKELKKELKSFFDSKIGEYSLFTRKNGNIEISKIGEEIKTFPPSLTFYKQFIIEYLLSLPLKKMNGVEVPEKIRILMDYSKQININIHDFLELNTNKIEDFKEEENPFTLCNNDLFVMEFSLNLFIDDIFKQYGIKTIKSINI